MSLLRQLMLDTPVGVWPMAEASGTVMADVSGNARHGTYVNVPTFGAADYLGRPASVGFDGAADYATVALDLTAYSAVTVAFWLYRSAFTNGDQLALEFSANAGANRGFYVDPDASGFASNQMAVTLTNTGGANYWQEWYNRPSVGWHQWHVIYDYSAPGTDQVRTFIDTAELATIGGGPANTDLTGSHANSTLYVAGRGGASLFAAQRMAMLAVLPGALAANRMTAHYQAALRGGVVVG